MRRVRLESVQNAADQGDLIAQVLGGADLQYDALPWFWSDQYDCKLQIAGLSSGYTNTVVRPGAKHNSQSTWYYADAPQARLEEALKERPNLSIVFLKKNMPTKYENGMEHYLQGLQKAGLGES